MFFKRFLGATSVAILGLAIYSFLPSTSIHVPFLDSGPVSSLTGVTGEDGPVLVVCLFTLFERRLRVWVKTGTRWQLHADGHAKLLSHSHLLCPVVDTAQIAVASLLAWQKA